MFVGWGPKSRQEVKGSKAVGVGYVMGRIITAITCLFRQHTPVSRDCGVSDYLNIVFFLRSNLVPTY